MEFLNNENIKTGINCEINIHKNTPISMRIYTNNCNNINYIYKATEEKKLYQWNDSLKVYEVISGGESGGSLDITAIHGGDADGVI